MTKETKIVWQDNMGGVNKQKYLGKKILPPGIGSAEGSKRK